MELTMPVSADEELGGRILKVNHAGENGAVNIYAGQILIARITARDMVSELTEFKLHEQRHRANLRRRRRKYDEFNRCVDHAGEESVLPFRGGREHVGRL